jgi:hypothetical protein
LSKSDDDIEIIDIKQEVNIKTKEKVVAKVRE